jgi:lipoprotein-anchoring transpeptidase ErfK/SrfK
VAWLGAVRAKALAVSLRNCYILTADAAAAQRSGISFFMRFAGGLTAWADRALGAGNIPKSRVFAVTNPVLRLLSVLALSALAACGAPKQDDAPPQAVPGYEGVEDEGFFIQPVDANLLGEGRSRAEVDYAGDDAPGTIVVDTFSRKLYYVMENGRAMRYAIAVGREGLSFRGNGVIGRKAKWPSWQPTANMVRTRPDLYAEYAGGRAGGLDNPLGARAMYLYRGGRDSMFRIHGTIQNETIGHATSAGCIRLFNQDAIELYERVDMGTRVKVRSLEESLAIEGPYMDDAYGRAVPETPENIAKKEADAAAIVEAEARKVEAEALAAEQAAKDAAKADKKRLSACKRKGIDAADCPALPELAAADAEASQG